MNIKELIIQRPDGNCLGDGWANKRVELTFNGIDLENDKRVIVEEVYKYIVYLRENCCHNNWLQDTLNIDEAKKLNAMMKCKTKETLRKKVSKFYFCIQQDQYDWLFHSKKICAWRNVIINLQEKENLWEVTPHDVQEWINKKEDK